MSCDTLSARMEAAKKKIVGLTQSATHEYCIMRKVHKQLHDVNKKAYKPVLLAIGPYNDQDEVGNGFMGDLKLHYLQQMLEKTKESVEKYIEALLKLEEKARKCYAECFRHHNSYQFVEMMLLDGCFIIELFRKFEIFQKTGDREDDPIFQMKWVLSRIARDLLLFENQLPFFVLAKLFEMSKSNNTLLHNRSKNLGEQVVVVNIDEEKNGSTSTAEIIHTQLNDLALNFFSGFLPFQWNANASSYNSTERIESLLCLACKADHTSSLPTMICERLKVGFRFKTAKFEHLLGLIHTSISISVLDTEIKHASKHQEVRVKLKKATITLLAKMEDMRKAITYAIASKFQKSGFQVNMVGKSKHLMYGPEKIEDWGSISLFGLDLRDAGVNFNLAKKFKDNLDKIKRQLKINVYIELEKDGTESEEAEKLKQELRPSDKELHDATIEFDKAKKLKRLHDLKEIEQWNIHSATELQEAGIKFMKAEKCDVFCMKFNNGRMKISNLSIQDQTETYLRNLIAYEEYCDKHNNGFDFVTNYVSFMDNLINSPKDVKLLRQRGIIHNWLGDDEVTSNMVNKLGRHITVATESSIYAKTSEDVNMHCKRRRNDWKAKLKRDYFNSPWALISFLAAVLLIVLSITQTVFSIIH